MRVCGVVAQTTQNKGVPTSALRRLLVDETHAATDSTPASAQNTLLFQLPSSEAAACCCGLMALLLRVTDHQENAGYLGDKLT